MGEVMNDGIDANVIRQVIRELRDDGCVKSSPLAGELAIAVGNFRKQWLPKEEEKETRLNGWRFVNAMLGSAFFLFFLTSSIFDDKESGRLLEGPFVGMSELVGPLDPGRLAIIGMGAALFAMLILFQKGKGGPVGLFLGGVSLPALAFWITKSAVT